MFLFIFLVFLFSSTAYASSFANQDDEITLLKMKQQLGNPDIFHYSVEGRIWCNGPQGNLFLECDSFGRVTSIMLQNLDVVAPFPDAICNLTRLGTFELLQSPGIYGSIPSCITKLSNLIFFVIVNTSISGPVPDFHNNTELIEIWLPFNHLSGIIPPSLSALPNLHLLSLSFNHLTGTVPPNLVHYTYSTLMLSNNNLTGELPKCYGLADFIEFDVSNNRLSGDASFLFGKEKQHIWYANLANNSFSFDLSYIEFPNSLYQLDLSHNNIYGKVPDSLANAPELAVLNLSFNKLCGELPQGGNMWKFKADDFANNECLCGSPLPPCFNSKPAPAPAPIYTPPF